MIASMKLPHNKRKLYHREANFDLCFIQNPKESWNTQANTDPTLACVSRDAVYLTFLLQTQELTASNTWVQQVQVSCLKRNWQTSLTWHCVKPSEVSTKEKVTPRQRINCLQHGCIITPCSDSGSLCLLMCDSVSSTDSHLWHSLIHAPTMSSHGYPSCDKLIHTGSKFLCLQLVEFRFWVLILLSSVLFVFVFFF